MIDFPINPATGTIVQAPNGVSWKWDGSAWMIVGTTQAYGVPPGGTVNQALMKKTTADYDMQWKSVSDLYSPAYVGPRLANPTDAWFGMGNGSVDIGYGVRSNLVFASIPTGSTFGVYHPTAGLLAQVDTKGVLSQGLRFGNSPPHGSTWKSIWMDGYEAAGDYGLLFAPNSTMINSGVAGSVSIRTGNTDRAVINSGSFSVNPPLNVNHIIKSEVNIDGSGSWANANVIARGMGGQGRIAVHAPGFAPQLRVYNMEGSIIICVSLDNTQYMPMGGSAFATMSSRKIKRAIRSLRPMPERVINRQPIDADEVAQPNIMDLRPAVFRPNVERITRLGGEDGTEIIDETNPVFVREGLRERLGLIAEEVAEVIPSAVLHRADESALGIDYAQITVALLDHVQQLTDTVTALTNRISELEGTPV